jgi:CheY-like chemotaxis protein
MKPALTGVVVDDEPQIRETFSSVLRHAGMRVFEAASGKTGLTLARRSHPDFIVTDIDMPEIDGLELCRRLRRAKSTRHVLIIVVSGIAAEQGDEAIAAGCDVVLAKPCPPSVLIATIRRLIAERS